MLSPLTDRQKKLHRRFAGQALIYIWGDEVASCSWEGRPPCRPQPMRKLPTELLALGISRMIVM